MGATTWSTWCFPTKVTCSLDLEFHQEDVQGGSCTFVPALEATAKQTSDEQIQRCIRVIAHMSICAKLCVTVKTKGQACKENSTSTVRNPTNPLDHTEPENHKLCLSVDRSERGTDAKADICSKHDELLRAPPTTTVVCR
jgi:hypothetical protein